MTVAISRDSPLPNTTRGNQNIIAQYCNEEILPSNDRKLFVDNDGEYRIVGEGGVIKVEVGSTLHLDCPVTQLSERPGTVMLWKKGHRVLTAGGIKVRRDPRMSLVGTDLTITQAGVHDGGLYRCEVEQDTDQPLAVVHTVEILGETSPPTSNLSLTSQCRPESSRSLLTGRSW